MFKQRRIVLQAPLSGDLWQSSCRERLAVSCVCLAVSSDMSWCCVGQCNLRDSRESPPSREQDLGLLSSAVSEQGESEINIEF